MAKKRNLITDPDFVNVEIIARQTVVYSQTKTISRKRWEEIKATPEREITDGDGILAELLDLTDICDWEDFDINTIRLVDAVGKPIKPKDEYEGGRS